MQLIRSHIRNQHIHEATGRVMRVSLWSRFGWSHAYKLSVYVCLAAAAECHVVVVKLSVRFNKGKGDCNNKMRSIFYTVMPPLAFSIHVVLRLLLLRRLQPGEPLVDLAGGKQGDTLKSFTSKGQISMMSRNI